MWQIHLEIELLGVRKVQVGAKRQVRVVEALNLSSSLTVFCFSFLPSRTVPRPVTASSCTSPLDPLHFTH